jgi:hypothetical protein
MQNRDLRCLEDLEEREEREERRGVRRHDGLTNKVPTRFIGTPGDSRQLDFLRITGRMTTGSPRDSGSCYWSKHAPYLDSSNE